MRPTARLTTMTLRAIVLGAFLAAFPLLTAAPLQAADWMFHPSYYSHSFSPGHNGGPVPEPRSAYRAAMVGAHPRAAIRGGYRYNSIVLSNGNSYDRVYYRENWFDAGY